MKEAISAPQVDKNHQNHKTNPTLMNMPGHGLLRLLDRSDRSLERHGTVVVGLSRVCSSVMWIVTPGRSTDLYQKWFVTPRPVDRLTGTKLLNSAMLGWYGHVSWGPLFSAVLWENRWQSPACTTPLDVLFLLVKRLGELAVWRSIS